MATKAEKKPNPAIELRPITGFSGYFIGRDGSVWSHLARMGTKGELVWRQMKPSRNSNGYLAVAIRPDGQRKHGDNPKTRYVHRLMLEAFVGPCPSGMVACHINDKRDDNRLENLRWGTHKSNSADALRNGGIKVGGESPHAKLSDKDVEIIRYLSDRGSRWEAIAIVFGLNYRTVNAIVKRVQRKRASGQATAPSEENRT